MGKNDRLRKLKGMGRIENINLDRTERGMMNVLMTFQAGHGVIIPLAKLLARSITTAYKNGILNAVYGHHNNVIRKIHALDLPDDMKEVVFEALDKDSFFKRKEKGDAEDLRQTGKEVAGQGEESSRHSNEAVTGGGDIQEGNKETDREGQETQP